LRTPRLSLVSAVAVALSVSLSAPASAQVLSGFQHTADGWVLHQDDQQFSVHPSVVSMRYADRETAVADRLAALGTGDPVLAGLTVLRSNRLGIVDVLLPADADPILVAAALSAQRGVEFAEPNTMGEYVATPNDTSYVMQWNLKNTGQTGGAVGADVSAEAAWDIQDGDPSVAIGVLDSGTEWNHPDLASNIWDNADEVIDGTDTDGNDNDPSGSFFHGTFVAGCVAASSNNGQGIAALAGGAVDGQGCSVMPVNVGSFSPNGAILDDAIIYAADNGVRVITLSLTVGMTTAINAAVDYAVDVQGVFIDCASGNGSSSVGYPANLPKIMAVASTNHLDVKSSFSNPGLQVEVAAPGENVFSTDIGGGYTTNSGTSFSAPHVAALAGLLFSEDPAATGPGVRALIRATADDVGPAGFDNGTGDGRINARNALLALAGGFVFAQADKYGTGTAGFGGLTPSIGTRSGPPTVGFSSYSMTLEDARPSSTAFNLISLGSAAVPAEGGIILVDLTLPGVSIQAYGTSVNGGALRVLPIPNDPVYVGVQAFSQWVIVDADGPAGYAFSDGLDMIIGS
jgi:subtilisin family serine protease